MMANHFKPKITQSLARWILRAALCCCVAFFSLFSATGKTETETRTVVKVVDGDTLRIRLPDGTTDLVRLIGIDAPEVHASEKQERQAHRAGSDGQHIQVLGERSAKFLRSRIEKESKIRLEYDIVPRDKYGRIQGYVFLQDGTFINEEIVRLGYAHLQTFPPNVKYLERLKGAYIDARTVQRGLWSYEEFDAQYRDPSNEGKRFPSAGKRVYDLPAGVGR